MLTILYILRLNLLDYWNATIFCLEWYTLWSSQGQIYFRSSCNWIYVAMLKLNVNLSMYVISHYTGCNRRNGPDFWRVFLRSNYTDITQNTYTQSWTVTEILAREKSALLWCLRTVLVSVTSFSPILELHSYVRANVTPATLATGGAFNSV